MGIIKVNVAKEWFLDNPAHNIWKIEIDLVQFPSIANKAGIDI